MITEEARQIQEATTRKERIEWLEEVIKMSGYYERLVVNDDFKKYAEWIQGIINGHKIAVESLLKELVESNEVLVRMEKENQLVKYKIEIDCLSVLINHPSQLIERCSKYREELAKLKEEDHAAARNGN